MATRPVFRPVPSAGLVDETNIDFDWYPGFSLAQKQRSIQSLHESARAILGATHILEVSTKSTNRIGAQLSAFNMRVQSEGRPLLLEAAFQGSKVYSSHGPHTELYELHNGREVKQRISRFANDELVGFVFNGHEWPTTPKTAFYDWLYLTSLHQLVDEIPEVGEELRTYDAFTDIEFNPAKSFSCQARSCALYLALERNEILTGALDDPDVFIDLLKGHGYGVSPSESEMFPGT